ncbi:hydrogen peroxide-inducible genes activator [Methylophaga nitratireducenticrescens]|uniref:Hydrogen peroxide-inducible genes activator n=1 Tax=Methylophaga nitratireducenticrescens TaxID=754476 RepID=I1XFK1_METNJ|nr:hydrogen peroxide-inducible genes activator [Methylophaga nitratireducenticrescens]AFI83170.1 hydrogen peroxide-inducible genes activator [Methylophaga nitratireducenticrescens]AUZ83309.1 hydrogen peroxide-inducible genes activator [Methylophaga nitratireducenticrescens]
MRLPTLRQLQYLTAVIDEKHFGRAAEKCHVTQSTLSAGIQDLEDLLEIGLLERTNRKVLTTPIGEEIAERARQILSLSDDLVDLAQAEKNPLAGRIRIGVIPTISPFLLPRVLPRIRKHLPELEVLLLEDQSERLLEQVEKGSIDIAIMAFPFNTRNLNFRVISQEPFWVALPKQHALSKYTSLQPHQLPITELLLLAEGHCMREHAISACQLPASAQRRSVQATSLYTLIEMVASGLGITLIPQMAINSDMVRHADICLRPLKQNSLANREIGLVWRPSFRRTSTLEELVISFTAAMEEAVI